MRRTKMVLPLRSLAANPASCVAVHTLDLSSSGAKLGAFRHEVKPGDVLTVQRMHKRAHCRIIWVRAVGPRETQVGIELLKSDDGFWGVPLDDSGASVCTSSFERW